MDITTIVGGIAGFAFLAMGILAGGELKAYLDAPSLLITCGGSFSAFLISSPLQNCVSNLSAIKRTVLWPQSIYAKVHPEMFAELNLDKPTPATDDEIQHLRTVLAKGSQTMLRAHRYPIGFGIIGAFIGLVSAIQAGDLTSIGPGLAISILAPFYGLVLSYLVILPLAHKIESRLNSLDEKFWR